MVGTLSDGGNEEVPMTADERIRLMLDAAPGRLHRIDRILLGDEKAEIPAADAGPVFVTVSEAARLLGTSRTSIWRLKCARKLEEVELMPGMIRLRRADVLALGTQKEVL